MSGAPQADIAALWTLRVREDEDSSNSPCIGTRGLEEEGHGRKLEQSSESGGGYGGGSFTAQTVDGDAVAAVPVAPEPMPSKNPYADQDLNSLDRDGLIRLLGARHDEMRALRDRMHPAQTVDRDIVAAVPAAPEPTPSKDPYAAQDLNSLDRDGLIRVLGARHDEMRALRDRMHRLLGMDSDIDAPLLNTNIPASHIIWAAALHMSFIIFERTILLREALCLEPDKIVAASLAVVEQVEADATMLTTELDSWICKILPFL
ncbi:hypothetical protein B0H16DRAFT_1712837 [Mycena metata]|uniref:Uncharacterized protein n=1 Tax=Mycena metata TaxID=1033252 RepID=A0AAD7K3M9_9AGAR|nr:hypothetical protein B0H16DRAFT_1712837 [Mycena metata]